MIGCRNIVAGSYANGGWPSEMYLIAASVLVKEYAVVLMALMRYSSKTQVTAD
jgi:hypothetical protein